MVALPVQVVRGLQFNAVIVHPDLDIPPLLTLTCKIVNACMQKKSEHRHVPGRDIVRATKYEKEIVLPLRFNR